MRITERQARERIRRAVEAAGCQKAVYEAAGMSKTAGQTAISKAVRGGTLHPTLLTHFGLHRNADGDIHTVEPVRAQFVDVKHVTDAVGVRRRLSSFVRCF